MRRAVATLMGGISLALTLISASSIPPAGASSSSQKRGAELFATTGCAHCHGPAGVGGAIGPDLQLVRKRMNAAGITAQISNGGKEMPAFGDELSGDQIKDIVAYLREKRPYVHVPTKAVPEPLKERVPEPN